LDLNQSKLNPRLVKTVLLGYFGHNGYKLLDKSTGAIFKSRDVIFEEGITHLVMNIEWDYSYYQPWSDNEWLVDEMIAMQEEALMA